MSKIIRHCTDCGRELKKGSCPEPETHTHRLLRAKCHECGKDVAVRVGGLLREHQPSPGRPSVGTWCPGSGKKARAPRKAPPAPPRQERERPSSLDPADALKALRQACYRCEGEIKALVPTGATNAQILSALRMLGDGALHGSDIHSHKVKGGSSPYVVIGAPGSPWIPADARQARRLAESSGGLMVFLSGRELADAVRLAYGIAQPGAAPVDEETRLYREALVRAGEVALGPAPARDVDEVVVRAAAIADPTVRLAVERGVFCMDGGRRAMIVVPSPLLRKVRSAIGP